METVGNSQKSGHEPRVRVGRQPAAWVRPLLPEPVELRLGEAPLEEGARVDARRRVPLEEHLVAGLPVVLAAEEVVEAHLVERGRGRVGGDVPADARAARAVRPRHHDRGVPPDVGADAPLDVLVAGEPRLPLRPDRVDVVRRAEAGDPDLLLARALKEAQHQVAGPPAAAGAGDGVERVDPLARLVRVDVRQLRGQPVADDGVTLTSGSHAPILAFRIRRLFAAGNSTELFRPIVVRLGLIFISTKR